MDQFIQAYELCKQNKALDESLMQALDEASIKTLIDVCKDKNYETSLKSLCPTPEPAEEKAKINWEEIVDKTALKEIMERAVKNGDVDRVKALIQMGVEFKTDNFSMFDAMLDAAHRGHLDFLKYLIELNVEADDLLHNHYELVLRTAMIENRLDIVKYLIEEKNANVQVAIKHYGFRSAAKKGSINVVKYFIENKYCSIDEFKKDDYELLSILLQNGCINLFEYVIQQLKF